MRAAVLSGGRFSIETLPDPTPGRGDAIVRVSACGICGTDYGIFANRLLPDGVVLGHEIAGEIVALHDGGREWREGDRVAAIPLPWCGRCESCSRGQENLCQAALTYMVGCSTAPGGLAEFVRIPTSSLRRLPERMSVRHGAVVEPAAVAMAAVRLGGIHPGTRVGVIGLGPLGLFAGLTARLEGALVFGVDERPTRVACARELGLGAFEADGLATERIRELTLGGPEVVIEASGKPEAIEMAGQMARLGGRVVLVASYHAAAEIRPGHWLQRGVSLLPSIAYGPGDYDAALSLVTSGRLDVARLVTSVHPLDDVQTVFERFTTQNDDIKLLISP